MRQLFHCLVSLKKVRHSSCHVVCVLLMYLYRVFCFVEQATQIEETDIQC